MAILLEPWFADRTKSLVKSPKVYLADTGLACFLLGIDTPAQLLASPLLGPLWETFVFAELRKRTTFARGTWDGLWFWRDARGLEVDFLVHRGGRYELLEAKVSEHPREGDAAALDKVAAALGGPERITRAQILCRTPAPYRFTSRAGLRVEATPVAAWTVDGS